uniref:La-kappaKTx4 n=1 Tax=Liocheles australasiae TaxID=431266 RepID=KKX24_LIOAU
MKPSSFAIALILVLFLGFTNAVSGEYAESISGDRMERAERAGCRIRCLQFTDDFEKCRKLCG